MILPRGNLTSDAPAGSLLANATLSDIDKARQVVKDAIAKMTKLNKARLENPARMNYNYKPVDGGNSKRDVTDQVDQDGAPSPLLDITDEIAAASALLAEVEAANSSAPAVEKRAGSFWLGGMTHRGTMPWGGDSSYKVFRNVVDDYKADPSGKTDSTAAIQKAISDGNRCGGSCNGATTKNAIVYFPPGTYLVSSSISVYFATQIIGDANSPPLIKASSSFVGLGVLSTDVYVPNGGNGADGGALEWYLNTARFYSQIRNINIDITATDKSAYVCAIHYQAAQAASIESVTLTATSGTTQQGMYTENGSGGVMSDVTFNGGAFGIWGGNQQFSASNLVFNGCDTAVQLNWDWVWVWQGITVKNCGTGFILTASGGTGAVGSVTFIDSIFSGISKSAIVLTKPVSTPDKGSTGVVLDNVALGGNIVDEKGNQLKASGYVKNWIIGPTYDSNNKRTWTGGAEMDYTREKSLLGPTVSGLTGAPYLWQSRPQYKGNSAGDFVSLKGYGAAGDGSTDDTAKVQAFFNAYAGNKIMFIDSGTYILTKTVTIPKNAQIVGECWAQFAASGSYFNDATNPKVMLQVGSDGDVGSPSLQDLILTTKGSTPGVILMEWNVQAASQGSAVLWDVHARVGGATGTSLTTTECPGTPGTVNGDKCKASSLLMHLTPKASGYFYNMWLWVADHTVDDPVAPSATHTLPSVSVYGARGFLIESQHATWLYGTAAEHSTYYQYNFHNAQKIFTTVIQTETAYYQPSPKPPQPFPSAVGKLPGDPVYSGCSASKPDKFSGCDASWAVIMEGSANIHVAGAGTYSWFNSWTQSCLLQHTCQNVLWHVDGNYDGIRLNNVITVGVPYSIDSSGTGLNSSADLAIDVGSAWSQFSNFDVPSGGSPPTPTGSACQTGDATWSNVVMPTGEFFNDAYYNYSIIPLSNTYYVTIVNLTPYTFHVTSSHSYQVSFNFQDIPSGKAFQARVDYGSGTQVDDNGEIYFAIQGTSKTFEVRTTTHIPGELPYRTVFDLTGMGLGQREYGDPYETSGVTLVITGSEKYGYISSLTFQPSNWMHGIYDSIKDRDLRHVVMPGSHDAAMDSITSQKAGLFLDAGGISSNTQTQSLNIYDQLRVGSRYFDMRIASINGGNYWGLHVPDEKAGAVSGATGESLDDMIQNINDFTSQYPGELIIWRIRYMLNIKDGDINVGNRYWSVDKANDFYDHLTKINNRCIGLSLTQKFDQQPMKNYLDMNNGAGCVLLITAGDLADGVPASRVDAGIYDGNNFNVDDFWAQKDNPRDNAATEVAHLINKPRDNSDSDNFFIMQWQCTPDFLTATEWGLDEVAIWGSNPTLYWAAVNAMSPSIFPTVILQDFIVSLLFLAVSFRL
jgi:hypothetical protein